MKSRAFLSQPAKGDEVLWVLGTSNSKIISEKHILQDIYLVSQSKRKGISKRGFMEDGSKVETFSG